MFEQQLINALSLGSVYALFALGFTLVFGVLGVINLAHGAIFMLGSYVALLLVNQFQMSLWLAMLIAMLTCGVIGVIVDFLVLRPLRKRNAPHLAPMIATIGVAIMITNVAQGFFGAENKRFPFGTIPEESFTVGNLHLTAVQLAIVLISFALMVVLLIIMRRTQLGRALRAIAESPKAAYLLGINVEGLFLFTSFAAAALGGAAGVLVGLSFNAISPFMGQPMLHKGIAVIILGGMGDIRGALIGGLFLGFAEVMSVAYLSSDFRDAVAFGLLFVILLVRPSGMFGKILERKA
ncbi:MULTISPECIES: branched-chain amino acid ABC transporter permease [Undibacterium]|jgi:branched-chain amino acid transport system permease protein|uniref:Branched-chain amino acid ABC transporter permease n=1 Tax=Undibacterium aquatile TaxID=1537398 RepID=A0ABR6XKC8_9BURK|nr:MULTISPECIES: branched-chain amino acid ABC transporter permease [Undibacterium]MBC3812806.1 branched-chain amino acid ABC transporter permease [Undibacterium aquatile]MBC3879295.1 branched-chain amino acid ABC transporter permease [Undibacterium sp. FT79W]MBC3929377.1 branched-chain amino acid ABC transporter permease [Undibacterium sp. CY21W]